MKYYPPPMPPRPTTAAAAGRSAAGPADPSGYPAAVRRVAARQRAIMYCILAYVPLAVLGGMVPNLGGTLFAALAVAASLTATVCVVRLAAALYSPGAAVALGVLTLVPIVGIVTLLVINQKATTYLRDRGLKVGLMGADLRRPRG